MISCEACQKIYSTPYNLKKHWQRQPMCEKWMNLQPGLKDFVDQKIKIQSESNEKEKNTTCLACKTTFASIGNLNKHLATSIICSKWDLYNDLEPIHGYMGKLYSEFDPPKYHLSHIIWNVYLIDKEFARKEEIADIIKENNIKYLIAILPKEGCDNDIQDTRSFNPFILSDPISSGNNAERTWLKDLKLDHTIMEYNGHNMSIDSENYDLQCQRIEEFRAKRENVFVFCNNGYQRSIPFLTYYLCKHHKDEIPTIERAIDIILPQVDKANYSSLRNKYIESMTALLYDFIEKSCV